MTMLHEGNTDLDGELFSATAAIRRALAGLGPGSQLSLDDVRAAFDRIREVQDARQLPGAGTGRSSDAEGDAAHSEYRSALTEWNRHLPRLHGWLLAERARLNSRRGHADRVRAWMNADQQTR